MAAEMQESLNVVEHIAKLLKNTLVNLKKSPKVRLTRSYVETRLSCVEDYWQKYQHAYENIIRNASTEKEVKIRYIEKNEFYEHEELYISLKSDLLELLGPKEVTVSAQVSEHQQTNVMLPKIQLPTYSGQYEDWMSFHDLFNTLVHMNKSLSNVQKLHYLKTSTTGEAASVLKNIQVTDSNYEIAWNTLKVRYGNKRIIINAVMRKLFLQKKIILNNSSNIKNLLDTTFECLHHLNNIKVNTESWDSIIIFVIVQKLDSETHKDWENYVSSNCIDFESLPSLEMLRKFLENRFRTLELTETGKPKTTYYAPIREKTFYVTTNEDNKICKMCNEQHTISHCKVFGRQTPTQRSEFVKTNNLCFNCLAAGHTVRYCRIPTCCQLCSRRHHTLLHETVEKNKNTTGYIKNTASNQPEVEVHTTMKNIEEEEDDVTMVASRISVKQNTALLATAIVQVRSEDNYKIPLRALIDQGSQASFISKRAAQLLKAKRYPIKGTVVGVGSTKENIKQAVQLNLSSTCEDYNLKVKTYVMATPLTTKIPSHKIRINNWSHLEGLTLADPNYFIPGDIDMLLGVDVYAQIIQSELIKGPPGTPCAHRTNFGWILFGRVEDTSQQRGSVVVMHHQIVEEELLKSLWEIEPDLKRKYTKENLCEGLYEETYKRSTEGRFVVKLPFLPKYPLSPDGNTKEIASRGASILELQHKSLWWNGPIWLANRDIEYTRPSTPTIDIERKGVIQSCIHTTNYEEKCLSFEEYESLTQLLRVMVYCKRFLRSKSKPEKLNIDITQELQDVSDICIRLAQDEEFSDEIKRLKGRKDVGNSSILKTLNPFLDDQNILRVGGRLRHAVIEENFKHPIILGKKSSFTSLVLADAHLNTMHGGVQLMITYLLSKYWIISCKSLVKKHIHGCLTCAKQRAVSRQQMMGDLPEARVNPARPFSRSGVDFAGPVYVLNSKGRGAKTNKAYICIFICIFICMAVKAIHLELVSELSAEAFIAAFKRFVARRGSCVEIWSDNGKNFVASNKELFAMWRDAGLEIPSSISNQLANDGTEWHNIPP